MPWHRRDDLAILRALGWTDGQLWRLIAGEGVLIGLIGASNVIDLTPNARFRLHKRVYFLPEASFFWRQSTQDGIYSVLSTPLRTGRLSNARFVGTQVSAPLQLTIDRHLTWTGLVTRFYSGAYLKQSPPGRSVTYFTTFVTYKF